MASITPLSLEHFRPNWGNGLTQNLLRLYNFSYPIKGAEVTGFGAPNTWSLTGSPFPSRQTNLGGSLYLPSTSDAIWGGEDAYRTSITNKLTVFADLTWMSGGANFTGLFGDMQHNLGGVNWNLGIRATGAAAFALNGGTAIAVSSNVWSGTAGERLRIVGTYDGANVYVWLNGIRSTGVAFSTNVTTTAYETAINRTNNTGNGSFFLRHAGILNRNWSDAEVIEWTLDPTSIFCSPSSLSRRFFGPAAGVADTLWAQACL